MHAAGRPAAATEGGSPAAGSPAPSMSRVRSSSPAIGALIREAAEQSTRSARWSRASTPATASSMSNPGSVARGVRAYLVAVTAAGQ